MTPRTEAIAYRIWAYCEPRGWDCTLTEIAYELNESVNRIRAVCQQRGWLYRVRKEYSWIKGGIDAPLLLVNEVKDQIAELRLR